jgi:hypothetical protein
MKISRRGFLKAAGKLAVGGYVAAAGGLAGYQYSLRIETEWLAILFGQKVRSGTVQGQRHVALHQQRHQRHWPARSFQLSA